MSIVVDYALYLTSINGFCVAKCRGTSHECYTCQEANRDSCIAVEMFGVTGGVYGTMAVGVMWSVVALILLSELNRSSGFTPDTIVSGCVL